MSHAAVDLGASNGRVVVGTVEGGRLHLEETNRFPNGAVPVGPRLFTDSLALLAGIVEGLRRGARTHDLASVGIDSWGVDYGRLDADGAALGWPAHYRDDRTLPFVETMASRIAPEGLFAATGIQTASFNSLYQLMADQAGPQWEVTRRVLFTPDFMGYLLSGTQGTETTIASTSQLLDPRTRQWSAETAGAIGLDLNLFPVLQEPGTVRGRVRAGLAGVVPRPIDVIAVAGHDTASALVAVPAEDAHFAFISCGTWSVAGCELTAPITTPEAMAAGFTNELGIDGTVRFARNLTGLWMLQECMREWADEGRPREVAELLAAAAARPGLVSVVDPGAPTFLSPGHMPERIADECRRVGQPVPADEGALVRCILDSLALSHARTVADAQRLGAPRVDVVHLIGGGCRGKLLCQLTADACGLPVVAGPVEAATIGNVLVQARAQGELEGDRWRLREIVRTSEPVQRYEPRGERGPWRAAQKRLQP